MSESTAVTESIRHSIEKHGFPRRAVQLPFRPVYESCRRHGTSLAEVLEALRQGGVVAALTGDHILFQTEEQGRRRAQRRRTGPGETAWPLVLGLQGLLAFWEHVLALAAQSLARMSPEQIEALQKLSPEDSRAWLAWFREFLTGKQSS